MNLLKGNKVKLRAVEPEDIDLLMKWENDTPLWEISSTLSPYSRAVLKDYIKSAHHDIYHNRQLRLMIERVDDGQTIGTLDIFEFDPFHQRAGIGILIADAEKRGNGFGYESLELVKDYCFKYLGLRQLFCNILEDNKPSLHLFEKAGFQINGNKRAWIRTGSQYKDQYFLQAFKEE